MPAPDLATGSDALDHEFSFSKADFDRVRELIYKHAGISLHDGKHAMVYSRLSRRLREQGRVVLRVLVKSDGSAGSVEVKSSSGFPRLDQSAIDAVKSWRFNPATLDGKPVDEWYQVPIPFKLQN